MCDARTGCPVTLSPVSLIGQWELAIQTPFGEQFVYLEFGDQRSGTARFGTESIDLADVSSAGNYASWTVSVVRPITATLQCTATLDGDTMSGTASAGFFGNFRLFGRRVAT